VSIFDFRFLKEIRQES